MNKIIIALIIGVVAIANSTPAQDQPKVGTVFYSNAYSAYKYQYHRKSKSYEHVRQPYSGAINSRFMIESDGITHVTPQKTSKVYLKYLGYYADCRCHVYQSDDPDIQVSISEVDSKITYEWNYDEPSDTYRETNVYAISNKSLY